MDIILYNILACLMSFIFGYFFGSIPFGVILCKHFRGEDPREKGSKNSGGTNVARLYGIKLGVLTILLDATKTVVPMILIWALLNFAGINDFFISALGQPILNKGYAAISLAAVGATVGHCFPIYANFRGGKAVASYAGYGISTCWFSFSISLVAFFTTLKISKHVSLSSIIGSAISTLISWILFVLNLVAKNLNINFLFWNFGKGSFWVAPNLEFAIASTLIFFILVLRHIPNIKRLVSGTESKVPWIK